MKKLKLTNSVNYELKRASSYPKIEDQLDMLWHALDSGSLDKTSDFYIELKKVKEKFPKT